MDVKICIFFFGRYCLTNNVCNKETNEQMQSRNTETGQDSNLERGGKAKKNSSRRSCSVLYLRYLGPEDLFFLILDISIVLRDTTLTISNFIETGTLVEIEIVRGVSLRATEITAITRCKTRSSRVGIP